MSIRQCSHCFTNYSFQEFTKLPHIWIDENHREYGKTPVCDCGRPFGIEKWQIKTDSGEYTISTVHLELAHGSNIALDCLNFNMFYETMIYNHVKDNWLPFQVRYATQKEALAGHNFTVDNLQWILQTPDKYPQSVVDQFLKYFKENAVEKSD